jgi:hypothetical protein
VVVGCGFADDGVAGLGRLLGEILRRIGGCLRCWRVARARRWGAVKVFGSVFVSIRDLHYDFEVYVLPLCRMVGMLVKKSIEGSMYCSVACVRRMLVFTSASAVCDAQSAGVHDPPHVKAGPLSRGLVIGWQVRMTWVRHEDRESKA